MAGPGGKTGEMFSFEFDPELATFRVAFENWAKLVKDWRPAWDNVRDLFRKHEAHHLNSEGATTGATFPPLRDRADGKPGYKTWKEKHYPGLPILQRERVLFRALAEGGPGSIYERTADSMRIGIKPGVVLTVKDKRYPLWLAARAHALGLGLPQRPPIRFDDNIRNRGSFAYAITQLMQAHIVMTRRKGFKKKIEDAIGGPAGATTGAERTIRSVLGRRWQ